MHFFCFVLWWCVIIWARLRYIIGCVMWMAMENIDIIIWKKEGGYVNVLSSDIFCWMIEKGPLVMLHVCSFIIGIGLGLKVRKCDSTGFDSYIHFHAHKHNETPPSHVTYSMNRPYLSVFGPSITDFCFSASLTFWGICSLFWLMNIWFWYAPESVRNIISFF